MSVRTTLLFAATALLVGGCAHLAEEMPVADAGIAPETQTSLKDSGPAPIANGYPVPVAAAAGAGQGDVAVTEQTAWGEPAMPPVILEGPKAVADTDGPYLLDTADRLRIFIYGQPNLSRLYIVDHDGRISVPLIGEVNARGKTTTELQHAIRAKLGAEFLRPRPGSRVQGWRKAVFLL